MRVRQIWRDPVKSAQGESVRRSRVTSLGLTWDRQLALHHEAVLLAHDADLNRVAAVVGIREGWRSFPLTSPEGDADLAHIRRSVDNIGGVSPLAGH